MKKRLKTQERSFSKEGDVGNQMLTLNKPERSTQPIVGAENPNQTTAK
jgi:hypothetical protein